MFHTFEATKATNDGGGGSSSAKRQRAKAPACQSCRRRKIRCDGDHPCGACKWYRKPSQCSFVSGPAPPTEPAAKRRAVGRMSTSKAILQRLFPEQPLHELASLSREQLVGRLQDGPSPASAGGTPVIDPKEQDSQDGDRDAQDDARSLEQLQAFPESETAAPSRPQSPRTTHGVTDDINALALSVGRARSYLGVSSVVAVLRIILFLDPDSKAFTSSSTNTNNGRVTLSREASEGGRAHPDPGDPSSALSPQPWRQLTMWDEVPAINAYFTYVHPQIPFLDEDDFRDCYVTRKRNDTRWKLLSNAVFAMGSAAANTAEDRAHLLFYERAREHMALETFGSASLETVQALAILGGMYLHYIQQPNLANFLVGATFRMATTLGLHRDYSESASASRLPHFSHTAELRRRTWWSLCSLDACNSNFLGRPTLGRLGPGHNARKPEHPVGNSTAITTLLRDSIDYCLISTRMDDYLADRLVLGSRIRQELDDAFLQWLNRPSAHCSEPTSPDTLAGVTVAMNVMRWRCLSARIFIYRPILLCYAIRRESMERTSEGKREAILTCRRIAAELIEDISSSWQMPSPCMMAGWPATWLIYQASMVPMLSLFCDSDRPDVVAACRQQVERAISTLSELEKWSCTARRSLEVVTRLYNASGAYHVRMQQQKQEQAGDGSCAMPQDTADATRTGTGTTNHYRAEDFQEGPTQEDSPSTHLSASLGEDYLLGNFFDDLSWVNNYDHSIHGVGNDLAFLDYYDI